MSHGTRSNTGFFAYAQTFGDTTDAFLKALSFFACFADAAGETPDEWLPFSRLGFFVAAPIAVLIAFCVLARELTVASAATSGAEALPAVAAPATPGATAPSPLALTAAPALGSASLERHLLADAGGETASEAAAPALRPQEVTLSAGQKFMLLLAFCGDMTQTAAILGLVLALLFRGVVGTGPTLQLSQGSLIGIFTALGLVSGIANYAGSRAAVAMIRKRPAPAVDFFTGLEILNQIFKSFVSSVILTACIIDAFTKSDVDTFVGFSLKAIYVAMLIAVFPTACAFSCSLVKPAPLLLKAPAPTKAATPAADTEVSPADGSAHLSLLPVRATTAAGRGGAMGLSDDGLYHLSSFSPFGNRTLLAPEAAPAPSPAAAPLIVSPKPLTLWQNFAAYGAWYAHSAQRAALPLFIAALFVRGVAGSAPDLTLTQGEFIAILIGVALVTGAFTRQKFTSTRDHMSRANAIAFATSSAAVVTPSNAASERGDRTHYIGMGSEDNPAGGTVAADRKVATDRKVPGSGINYGQITVAEFGRL